MTIFKSIIFLVAIVIALLNRGSGNQLPLYLVMLGIMVSVFYPQGDWRFSKEIPGVFLKNHTRCLESSIELVVSTLMIVLVMFLIPLPII